MDHGWFYIYFTETKIDVVSCIKLVDLKQNICKCMYHESAKVVDYLILYEASNIKPRNQSNTDRKMIIYNNKHTSNTRIIIIIII